MGWSWSGRRVSIGLDNRVILWKPQPSQLTDNSPWQRSLMSLTPFLNHLRENVGRKIGSKSFVVVSLPRVWNKYVVSHVLANRGEVDTSGDTQTLKFSWISDSGKHKKLWSVEHPRTQDDLFTGGHSPSFTCYYVNEKVDAIRACWLTWRSSSKLNPIETRNLAPKISGLKKLCSMSVQKDVQIRAIDIIRSNIGGSRTAASTVTNGALCPTKADLSHGTGAGQKTDCITQQPQTYGVTDIHVSLEGKFGREGRFIGGCKNSWINRPWVPRNTNGHHPVMTVCWREVLTRLGRAMRMSKRICFWPTSLWLSFGGT